MIDTRDRDALVRLLVERFRHKPPVLSVPQTVAVIRRLIKHARWMSNGCILWTGALNHRHYGKLNVRLRGEHFQFYVHKLAWSLATGRWDLPHWRQIAHSCDVPPCLHPDHVSDECRTWNQRRSAVRTNAKIRGEIPRAPQDYREAA